MMYDTANGLRVNPLKLISIEVEIGKYKRNPTNQFDKTLWLQNPSIKTVETTSTFRLMKTRISDIIMAKR